MGISINAVSRDSAKACLNLVGWGLTWYIIIFLDRELHPHGSIPLGSVGGRSVCYRMGGSRGQYVQGKPVLTVIDQGTVHITNKHVVFQGSKQTRVVIFSVLLGFQRSDKDGSTTFSVSNRQQPTIIRYGQSLAVDFDFRLDLASRTSKARSTRSLPRCKRPRPDRRLSPKPLTAIPTPLTHRPHST